MEIGKNTGVKLDFLGHSGFLINNGKRIVIDPYNVSDRMEKADIILITHSHYDHCSVADMEKIVKEGTRIIAPADCQSKITRFEVPIKIEVVERDQEVVYGDVKISTIPA